MDWLIESFRRFAQRNPYADLKDEILLREREHKEILRLERETEVELEDVEQSIREIDSSIELAKRKLDSIRDLPTSIKTIHSINRMLLIRFQKVRRIILLDESRDQREEAEIRQLEQDNFKEIQDEEDEAEGFEEEQDEETQGLAKERLSIDQDEEAEEKKLDTDLRMDEKLVKEIISDRLYSTYPEYLNRQNSRIRRGGQFQDEIKEEICFLEKLEGLEQMRKVVIGQEMSHEMEIDLDEVAARELDKRTVQTESDKKGLSKRISRRKFLE